MPLIRTTGSFPPAGFVFTDPRSGLKFPGMECTFAEQVARIIQHRLSNYGPGKLYNDAKFIGQSEVERELADYTCNRLGNDKRFCISEADTATIALREKYYQQVDSRVCPKCGSGLSDKLCATCAGHRVIGSECKTCGFSILK